MLNGYTILYTKSNKVGDAKMTFSSTWLNIGRSWTMARSARNINMEPNESAYSSFSYTSWRMLVAILACLWILVMHEIEILLHTTLVRAVMMFETDRTRENSPSERKMMLGSFIQSSLRNLIVCREPSSCKSCELRQRERSCLISKM